MEEFERKKLEIGKKQKVEIQPPEFEYKRFEKSIKGFENLIKQLAPVFKNNEYHIVVGDDISGRIPTLVIGELMKAINRENKLASPQVLFLPAGHGTPLRFRKINDSVQSAFNDYFKELSLVGKIDSSNDKVLIVTESIMDGISIENLVKLWGEKGFSCDVATLSSNIDPKLYSDPDSDCYRPGLDGIKIYDGGETMPSFWPEDPSNVGVSRDYRNIFSQKNKPESSYERDRIIGNRRDVKKMADYLKQIYDRENEKLEKQNEI